jgi:potassium-transporting ATPase KdpC subunit
MKTQVRPAMVCFVLLSVLTGAIYPALVTLVAQTAFQHKARGSVIVRDDRAVGSALIAQPFTHARYFWPRPSACNYDGAAGAGSNQGPTNPARAKGVTERSAAQQTANQSTMAVPVDLVTASGSGLDPHITPEAATYQIHRVAAARGMTDDAVQAIVDQIAQARTLGVLGEPRVNVLKLNLALDHPELLEHPRMAGPAPIRTYRWRGFLPD